MACVYILFSNKTRKCYIGSSRENNPGRRLKSHNAGKTKSTKFGRPWILILYEEYKIYTMARKRELFLKTGKGRAYIKQIVQSWQIREVV